MNFEQKLEDARRRLRECADSLAWIDSEASLHLYVGSPFNSRHNQPLMRSETFEAIREAVRHDLASTMGVIKLEVETYERLLRKRAPQPELEDA